MSGTLLVLGAGGHGKFVAEAALLRPTQFDADISDNLELKEQAGTNLVPHRTPKYYAPALILGSASLVR